MTGKKPKPVPVFVVDTNVIIDYPDIIPNGEESIPDGPTVDTNGAHIVVPTAVIRELSSFKGEGSERGKVARVVLKRIRKLVECEEAEMNEAYELKAPITISNERGLFSVLPVHKDFVELEGLPFDPNENDMDGQIILASLSAKKFVGHKNTTLLTNDNGLAIRAWARGVKTSRYGYRLPDPYIGRREVKVPFDLYHEWEKSHKLTLKEWSSQMLDEPPLKPNEYVIMDPEDWYHPITGFTNIGRYDSRAGAIVSLNYPRNLPYEIRYAGHACYADALYNKAIEVVIATGRAGTGKTYMATVYALEAYKRGDYIGIIVLVRQSDDGLGALPGDLDDKLDPNAQPIKNALRNYFLATDKNFIKQMERLKDGKRDKFEDKPSKSKGSGEGKGNSRKAEGEQSGEVPQKKSLAKQIDDKVDLTWKNWFQNIPVTRDLGRDFAYQIAICDETQDLTRNDVDTALKRNHESKMIFTGDVNQIHGMAYLDEYNNGLAHLCREMEGDEGVALVTLLPSETMRGSLIARINQRQEDSKKKNRRPELA